MTPKGYLTSQDLDEMKKEIEKDPNVKIEWLFSGDNIKGSADDIKIEEYPHSQKTDKDLGLAYHIISISNISKQAIFADVKLCISSHITFDSVFAKRLKHPEFYAVKTPEQLRQIFFGIQLWNEALETSEFTTRHKLDYIYPKSTHHYLFRIKPHSFGVYAPVDFVIRGNFI